MVSNNPEYRISQPPVDANARGELRIKILNSVLETLRANRRPTEIERRAMEMNRWAMKVVKALDAKDGGRTATSIVDEATMVGIDREELKAVVKAIRNGKKSLK